MTGADNEKGTAAPGHASRGPVPQAESLPEGESLGMLLFEMTAQGVVCQDPTGIVSANPAAQRILGLTWEQMQGRATGNPDWHIIHEDGTVFPADEQPGMMALRTGREVRDIVLAVVNPQDLSRRWLNVTAKPLFRHGESTPFRCLVFF
jgi:PAS domain-containing protein